MSRTNLAHRYVGALRRLFAAVVGVVLIAAACSSDGENAADDTSPDGETTAQSGGLPLVRGDIQQLWVFDRIVAIELDGSENDVTANVVDLAEHDAGDPVDITSVSTFAASSSVTPEMLDASGEVLDTVDMVAGVLETEDGVRSLAVLATPDHGEWIIGLDNTLLLDLPEEAGVTRGTPMVFDYVYAQYLPVEGAASLDDDQTPVELWQERADLGAIAYLDDGVGNSQMLTGEIGQATTLDHGGVAFAQSGDDLTDEVTNYANDKLIEEVTKETADKMGIPADAVPLIESIEKGARKSLDGKCRSATCVKNLTDEIEEGFKRSLKRIDDQLDPDPDEDPDPDPDPDDPPPTSNPTTTTTPRTTTTTPRTTTTKPPPTTTPPTTTCAGCPPPDPPGNPPGNPPGPGGPGGGGTPGSPPGGGGTPGSPPGGGGGGNGTGGSTNDPHIYTFDGQSFGLQYIGEFTLVQTDDLEVQVRYEPLACDCLASVGTATVVTDGETRVQVSAVEAQRLLVDGEPADVEAGPLTAGDFTIEAVEGGYRITNSAGTAVTMWVDSTKVNTWVTAAGDDAWAGILGNRNGDPVDDFTTRDGENLGAVAADVDWDRFADSWRIAEATSAFEYFPGRSTSTYVDAEYPAPHPEVSSEDLAADREARAVQADVVCRAAGITDPEVLDDCIFDFTITGSSSLVRESRRGEFTLGRSEGATGSATTDGAGAAVPLDGLALAEESGYPHVTGDGLVLVRVEDEDEVGVLLAVDASTHAIRWTAADIDVGARPVVVDGIGVVARLAPGSATLGDDPDGIVVLSSQDGSEQARHVGDDVGGNLAGDGGTNVVLQQGGHLQAFTVSDADITPTWSRELDYRGRALAIDGHLVAEVEHTAGSARFEAFALATGDVVSSIAIAGESLTRMDQVGDDVFVALMEGQPRVLTLIEVVDGELNRRWLKEQDPDDPDFPTYLVRAGDVITGWTKHHVGGNGARGPIAYDMADGETAWTYTASSFDNNHGMLGASDDFVVLSSMGGDWLEIVDASDGSEVEIIDEAPSGTGGGPRKYTALADGTFMITNVSDGGISFEFISPTG